MKSVKAVINDSSYVWTEKSEFSLEIFKENMYKIQEEIKKAKSLLPYKERDLVSTDLQFIDSIIPDEITQEEYFKSRESALAIIKATDLKNIKTVAQIQDFLSKIVGVL